MREPPDRHADPAEPGAPGTSAAKPGPADAPPATPGPQDTPPATPGPPDAPPATPGPQSKPPATPGPPDVLVAGADPSGTAPAKPGSPGGAGRRTAERGRGGALAYAGLVPVAVAAGLVVGPPAYVAYLLWPLAPLVLVAVWWLPAPLYLLAGVRRALAVPLYGCRVPTDTEAGRLRDPWRAVLDRAGQDQGRHPLLVVDSAELNAGSTGGGIVTVTSHAAGELEPGELAAVLAHELGHRLAGPSRVLEFGYAVLLAPVRAMERAGRGARWSVRAAHRGARRWGTPAGYVGVGLLAVLAAVVSVAAAVPGAVAFAGLRLAGMTGPRAEYAADRAAAALGLGPDLLALLERRIDVGEYGPARRSRATIPDRAQRLRRTLPDLPA
ncbi:M48 family metalloprotease [Actinomadura craniellae]|uniref:M48 family metalloprotease n=1 Tax=Actinomadura craniellae TaxID=2231787 RepID=UPI001313E238|nr:M48 family metalloprotease [Actinomadura craniellae]